MRRTALGLFFLVLVSCKGDRTISPPSANTPVFIVSIDTLRSDHLPVYGYKGVDTPHIDAFRKDGVLYERAYSHTPLTLPSHASLMTGLLPSEHGVRDNIGYQLRSGATTVASMLKSRGYATGAAVSAFVLRRQTGLDRGFDFYDDDVDALPGQEGITGNIQREGEATVRIAKEWIVRQQKPVFFFLHLYEPHTPYAPPERFKKYSSPYDGEIAHADEIVGEFLKSLKDAGLYDKALIVIMSDHGEGLGEHGEEEHGLFLYREAIQVPLIIKLPDQKFSGERVSAPVQLIDLFPTIAERTGVTAPATLRGQSLVSFFLKDQPPARGAIYSESYYARLHFGWADQHSLIDGERHYIHSPKPELFNVRDDTAETKNILTEDRRGFFAMKAAITPFIREADAPSAVDPEEAAKLAALGYLGSTVSTKPGEVLPDPKDHLGTIKDIERAFALFRARKLDESMLLIERLLAENERILDLYDLKAKALGQLGRYDEAIATAKQALIQGPQNTHLALEIARNQLEIGRLDDAQKHAELALKVHPGPAHDLLARIWEERKDFVRAEKEARLAMQSQRDRAAALVTLARIERDQGKLEQALAHLDEAEKIRKPTQTVAGLHFVRGDVLARMGRAEEAERELRTEIRLFPNEPLAYKNLVVLLVAEGRVREGTALIRQLIATSPTPPSYLAVCDVLEILGDTRGVRYWARQGLLRYPNDPALRRLAG